MTDEEPALARVVSFDEAKQYRTDLRIELANLEFAQAIFATEYKQERIDRLRGRLGISLT